MATQQPENNFCEIVLLVNQNQMKDKPFKRVPSGNHQPELSPEQSAPPEEQKVRLKSRCRKIMVGLIISLSAVMFGYSIKEITSVNIDTLVIKYSIGFDKFLAQSILIGILPLAAIIGSIITRHFIKVFRRLTGIYVFTFVNIGAIVLVNITFFYTLLIGRFIQGICIGFYSAIAPVYLRQIAPKELRRMLGLFFSFGKIVGVLISIAVELIVVQALNLDYGFRIILSLTALFSVLQAILIFFFGSDTPTEHIEKGNHEEAKQIIKRFYHEEYVQQVMEEYTSEYQASQVDVVDDPKEGDKKKKKRKRNSSPEELKKKSEKPQRKVYKHNHDLTKAKLQGQNKNQLQSYYQSQFDVQGQIQGQQSQSVAESIDSINTHVPTLTFDQKKHKAYILGVHLSGIRNFVGANAIITQGGIFISLFNPELGKYTSLIVNVVQFAAVVFGMVYVQTIMGKKQLFLISIPTLSVLSFALVIAMIFQNVAAMLMLMCIYLIVFGIGFINPIWAYPAEVIPAAKQLPANILHWFSIAIVMLIPPLVASFMPKNNPYPVFIFFGIYAFIGFIHVRTTLRESDGLTYKQIIQSFK